MSQITIRRATVQDAAAYARILSQPEVMAQLLQVPFNDEQVWRAKLTETTAAGKPDVPLVAEIGGEVVGTAGLHPAGVPLRRRHAMYVGIGVAREYHGCGVGSALMRAMCDYADNWGQVLRLELTVFADNHKAIALYRKFGFEREGLHRGFALRAGEYVDVLSMARLHPNPPRIPSPEVAELR